MRLCALIASMFFAVSAVPAAANGFVNNRAQWLQLSPEAQAAYAQGLNDSLNLVFADDDLNAALVKVGRTQCMIENKITAAMLADKISAAYRDERFAQLKPAAVYLIRITDECKGTINQTRLSFGLGPM